MAVTLSLLLLVASATAAARHGGLARRDTGDIFTLRDGSECNAMQCAEHGAGAVSGDIIGACACVCPPRAPLFREDRELCVDDLPECSLASFGTGSNTQRIPFVYLPLKGQIIHPSREITFKNVKTPICAVSGAQFLTRKGFLDLRNTLDADVPFNLFRDEGRTFLQWSGEDDLRARMTGRVMVVRLLCRDVAATPTSPLDLRGVFTPCVAFRVQGTPHRSNVTEVQFASNAHTAEAGNTSGLTVTEYVAIGISSLFLGLVYIASVFLFLHIRKRRKAASDEGDSLRRLQGLKKKDGSSITERDIIRVNNERMQTLPNAMGQDNGIVKKNPLISMNRFHDSKSFPSDSGSNMSDSEDFGDSSVRSDENMFHTKTTAALIHQHNNDLKTNNEITEQSHRDESGIERLPDEHVSIVETTDDREITRPVGTTRRKLYFNPAYFEPHLMAEPPPAALEFLVKIREVIAIAKHKMEAKRFQPVLNEIPEEETYSSNGNSIDVYQSMGSQRSGSVISLKRENSRKKNCLGCPGCKSDNGNDLSHSSKHSIPSCTNCISGKGDKQHSIRKWLENIPPAKQVYNDFSPKTNPSPISHSLLSLPIVEHKHKIKKQNSFTSSAAMYLSENFSKPRKLSTKSVRSEPGMRTHNYNLPLPEFKRSDCLSNNYNYFAQTIAQVDDISPIGFDGYRPSSLRYHITNQRRIKNDLPDMVNEAIALDHCTKSYNQNSSDEEQFLNNNPNASIQHPFIRNQSESPVANDYETDSLERTSNKKGVLTPTEYLDIPSSQASPSLSNALPLEEELTMRNDVYKGSSNSNTPSPHREMSIEKALYETASKSNKIATPILVSKTTKPNSDYSLVSEVYVNNNYNFESAPTSPSGSECSAGNRKNIISAIALEEKPGCLTIEVKDSPENYIKIHESDGFEPDTLDRKHPKHKNVMESVEIGTNLLNLNAIQEQQNQRIQLRSSGTFKKSVDREECPTQFHSLRNEYEQRAIYDCPKLSPILFSGAKSLGDTNTEDIWEDAAEWEKEEGRILTLELRHSKRQRQSTPPTIKQMKTLARPDVLPPLPPSDNEPIYEQPAFPPRRVESEIESHSKNLSGRSLNPRTLNKSTTNEIVASDSTYIGAESSSSTTRASVQSQSSEYENINLISHRTAGDSSNHFSRMRSDRGCSGGINTDTFVKSVKTESKKFRRKKSIIQDSGYLSSDSTSSRQVQRKLVAAKIASCSESDDTENEARSESGAESVETHSVYFDSFRQPQINIESDYSYNNDSKSSRESVRKKRSDDSIPVPY